MPSFSGETSQGDMIAYESAELIERWKAKQQVALVICILIGETSVVVQRSGGQDYREKFPLFAENEFTNATEGQKVVRRKQKAGDLQT